MKRFRHFQRAMFSRALLIFTLVLSLLFAPQARPMMPAPAKMPGCAMMTCMSGCCAQMACCAKSAQDRNAPDQSPASQRVSLELAALGLRTVTILHVLPAVERRLASREVAQAAQRYSCNSPLGRISNNFSRTGCERRQLGQ